MENTHTRPKKRKQQLFYVIVFWKNPKQVHERIFKEPSKALGYKQGIEESKVFSAVHTKFLTNSDLRGKRHLIR